MREPLRRRVRARVLRGAGRLSSVLPLSLTRGLLTAATPLARGSRPYRLALANLELALGAELDAPRRAALARAVLRHSARQLAEWLRLARGDAGPWIDRTVELDDSVDVIREQVASGTGCLIVTPHIGNWELLAARLHREGLKGAVIGRFRPRDSSSNWLVDMRRAYGVTTLPQDSSPREIFEVLRRGHTIGMLPDLEVRRLDGVFLPFFGVDALTMTAPAALARAARLPLVPARCVATGADTYRLSADEPLWLDRALDRREGVADLLRRQNAVFERFIREDPDQWAWHQPRWRTRPGEHDPRPLAARLRDEAREPGPEPRE